MLSNFTCLCADPECSNSYVLFFLVDEGRDDHNTTKKEPLLAGQQNAIEMVSLAVQGWPNIECWLGFQAIWTSIAKKPYIFVIFQGGGVSGPRPPLWIRT